MSTSNTNPERSRRMIDEAINGVAKELNAAKPQDAQSQAMFRARDVVQKVTKEFTGRVRLMPLRPSKEEAFTMLAQLLRDGFKDWSRDDLLYINSLCHATLLQETLSDFIA
jgi:hypothetical protein